jgi:alpha-mannosidase
MSLMLPPIGTDADPSAIQAEQRSFQQRTGLDQALWTPGVGDHGGGPTAEMLEQMQLWQGHPQVAPRQSSTVRAYLESLEASASGLPVWRDELYLDLHRGCATSRPDQKRHNRSLERLLREADLTAALLHLHQGVPSAVAADWRSLLFQQFHDILPGTSIPEVFEQAEPQWRQSRRQATSLRDRALQQLFGSPHGQEDWAFVGLQPLARWSPLLRLPVGQWRAAGQGLPTQPASSGGVWVQLPEHEGVMAWPLERRPKADSIPDQSAVRGAVQVQSTPDGVRLANGQLTVELGADGLRQLWDAAGVPQLQGPLALRRFRDHGEFWDAWDLAANYRDHPLPVRWDPAGYELVECGPLVARVVLRARVGASRLRLDCLLRADTPWLELICSVEWQQTHELLRLELPLAQSVVRWAADTSGGVLERPARPLTPGEKVRWEVPVISWCASTTDAPGGGLALLLDGPQGVDADQERLGVSLLRGPTWPDPNADRGWHRHRLALMPVSEGWCRAGVPQAALAFREPGWCRPASLQDCSRLMPAVPVGLVPVAVEAPQTCATGAEETRCLRLRLLNPGARRQVWSPPDWLLMRGGDVVSAITLMPGELTLVDMLPKTG